MALLDREERMECREFERLIPGFLKGELDYPTLKQFLAHRESCSECREELDIQFLVAEGMQHLEEGNAFDLQSELEQRLEEKGYQVKLQVTKQSEKANFVEDMFKQGTPSAGGMVHRYSFDVRA